MRKSSSGTTVRVPKVMRKDLQQVLDQDGRKLGEFTRGLYANAIRQFRDHRVPQKAAPHAIA